MYLQRDDLCLTLLPGIGGRLWDVNFQDYSILFQNPDLEGLTVDERQLDDLPTRSPQFGFPLWGGEKTWIAPDTAWLNGAPFPVLDSGVYQVTSKGNNHIEMTSAICPMSFLSITRRITLNAADSWIIDNLVTNHGSCKRLTGIWSVMMLNTPTTIGIKVDTPVFHTVFGFAQEMVTMHDSCIVTNCTRQQEFKIGLPNPLGTTLISCGKDGPLLKCTVQEPKQDDIFAHTHPVEIFNSGDYLYCEVEWHSPLHDIRPQETLSFQQEFRIFASSDTSRNRNLLSCMF